MVKSKILKVDLGVEEVCVQVPQEPEQWMEHFWDAHGQRDACFPFWLEIWPCAFGLYRYFASKGKNLHNALEIGCGCGVLAQLLAKFPGCLWHSDLMPEACAYTAQTLSFSGSRPVIAMDFHHPCVHRKFPLIFGADLFYDDSLVQGICSFTAQHLELGGNAYFAEPGRSGREKVPGILRDSGLGLESMVWNWTMDGVQKNMNLHRLYIQDRTESSETL